MNDHTRGRVFAPCRGARWGVCNTPLHGYDHSGPRTRLNISTGPQAPTSQRPIGANARTRPAQGFALGYDPAPLQGARVPAPTNQTGPRARMGRTRPAQGFALGYDSAPLQGARVPAPTNQRAPGPEWDVPGRAVGPGVCGRRRIWPGTRPIGANDRTGVGAY